ncbi:hypothetical protein MAR_017599 [Mya arenaria]|uniref:Uncharacterized protein n=1 Tax=Mya arenaria TaxID=6604 RepID=A0ABY7EFS6_MYAAR|nr:hypothetical protein MAR_017599 [Mya arenaria]
MKLSIQTKGIHHFVETGLAKLRGGDSLFKSLLIWAYYKPHEHGQHSWAEFTKSLNKASKLNCNIWVAGDFNLPK